MPIRAASNVCASEISPETPSSSRREVISPPPRGAQALAAVAAALRGWRRAGLLVLLGALAALALPPVHAVPVLLLSFPGLIWLLDGAATRKGAFATGWWFGLGHFTAGFYWISYALLVDAARFGWMIPFAVGGLAAGMAIFTGLATLLAKASGARGLGRVLALAAAWMLMEWLRSWVLTGFPWNLLGTVWETTPSVLQFAAVGGTYGLTLLTVAVAGLPALLAAQAPARARWGAVAAGLGLLAAVAAGGAWRLAGAGDGMQPGVMLRLVQANVAQTAKWRDDLRQAHLMEHLRLSRSPGFSSVTHVIWPETAAPYFLEWDEGARRAVASVAPPGGMVLTGAVRTNNAQPFQVWNSLQAISPAGVIEGSYDKAHLVPFGEYAPLRDILPMGKLTAGSTDFSAGPGPRTVTLPGLPPFSPLICYEVIFPGAVVARDGGPRPQWLLTITNDGWFGLSAGPYQHFAAARMRAVEEGLPLVRAANTGISGVVDAYGRTVAQLGLGEGGVVDSPLPKPLLTETIYGRMGNWIPLIFAAIVFGVALRMRRLG